MTTVAAALLVGLMTAFWWAYTTNASVKERRADISRRSSQTFTLGGMALPLDRYVSPPLTRHASARSRYLVLLMSDSCPKSRDLLASWQRLLSTAAFASDDTIILISALGTTMQSQLSAVLAQRGVSYQSLHVQNAMAFTQQTGLGFTPMTAVLDADLTVRLVSGRYTKELEEELWSFFGKGTLEAQNGGVR